MHPNSLFFAKVYSTFYTSSSGNNLDRLALLLVNPTSILFLLFVFLRLLCMLPQMLSYHFHKLGRHLTNRRGRCGDRSRIRCDTFCVLQSLAERFGGCVGRISGACVSYNVRIARCVADEPNAVFCLWSWYDSLLPQMRRNIRHFHG